MWRANGGAPCSISVPGSRVASAGATRGISISETSSAFHGTENAASASAVRTPSCSIRAERVLSERPARSSTVTMRTGPGWGARA